MIFKLSDRFEYELYVDLRELCVYCELHVVSTLSYGIVLDCIEAVDWPKHAVLKLSTCCGVLCESCRLAEAQGAKAVDRLCCDSLCVDCRQAKACSAEAVDRIFSVIQ